METLLLTFANQQSKLLPTLQEEDDTLNRILAPHVRLGHLQLLRESFVTLEKLYQSLTLYREELVLFLFSGHAGRDKLELGDGESYGGAIAGMLRKCPRLKLVFLNGCSTAGQVDQILDCEIPVVIASSAAIEDDRATFFSIRFFEALERQFTIKEAFEMAREALEAKSREIHPEISIYKNTGFSEPEAPLWGLYYKEHNEHVLDWKLPNQVAGTATPEQFTPNKLLIDALFQSLSPLNDEVGKMAEQEQQGIAVSVPRKRMVVLNALPALLAEPVRKLFATVEEQDKGYDKISEARVRQIVRAYETSMELLSFLVLAQVWDAFYANPPLQLEPRQRNMLNAFLKVSKSDREVLDYSPLIVECLDILEKHKIALFIPELNHIRRLVQDDKLSVEALRTLHAIRLQVGLGTLNPSMIGHWCRFGEECLASLYAQICFLVKYKLATIQDIEVLKFKHRRIADYNHNAVKLHDLLGGYELSQVNTTAPLDNRSTLLLQQDNQKFLNLSPFVIDENAFRKSDDICRMYFFSHYLEKADIYCFKYVNTPENSYLEVSANKYPLIREQFQAFVKLLNS